MSTVGLRSLQRAALASRAQADLQRRWGTLSCQATLLPKAESILAQAEEQSTDPVPVRRLQLPLGTQNFELIFTDEQAKASANLIYDTFGAADTEQRLRDLLPALGTSANIRLIPVESVPKIPGQPAFIGYGQIFPEAQPGQLVGQDQGQGAIDQITCFGNGTINFRRASREALQAVCLPVLNYSQIDQLLTWRKQYPQMPLAVALDQLQLSKENRDKAGSRLSDRSSCHGLWVIVTSNQRAWYHLAVAAEAAADAGAGAEGRGHSRISFSEW
jgi:hypothetical protein